MRTHRPDFGRQPSTVPTDAREIRRADEVLFGSGSLTVLKWQVGRSATYDSWVYEVAGTGVE